MLTAFAFVFAHPLVILAVLGIVIIGSIALTNGTALTFWLKPRVMLVCAVIAGVLAFASVENENSALRADNAAIHVQMQQVTDGQKAVTLKSTLQATNQTHAAAVQTARTAAPTGEKTDAVLDAIAAQDSGSPSADSELDGLRNTAVDSVKP